MDAQSVLTSYFDKKVWDSRLIEVNLQSHKLFLLPFYPFEYPVNVSVFLQKSLVFNFCSAKNHFNATSVSSQRPGSFFNLAVPWQWMLPLAWNSYLYQCHSAPSVPYNQCFMKLCKRWLKKPLGDVWIVYYFFPPFLVGTIMWSIWKQWMQFRPVHVCWWEGKNDRRGSLAVNDCFQFILPFLPVRIIACYVAHISW